MNYTILCFIWLLFFTSSTGVKTRKSNNGLWNDKKCAVVLTYDDAMDVHLDNVVPVLDSLGLKATFYITGKSSSLSARLPEWRAVANSGHELGNHTLFHPCHGKSKKRKWVNPEYDLDDYTMNRFIDEIKMENTLLSAIDGKQKRTFAYTCGDTTAGNSSFVEELKKYVVAARGVKQGLNYLNSIDLFDIKVTGVHKQPVEQLIQKIEKAKQEGALLVFLFHGVGGGIPYSISTEDHKKLVTYLKQNESDIMIAPLVEIAGFIRASKKTKE